MALWPSNTQNVVSATGAVPAGPGDHGERHLQMTEAGAEREPHPVDDQRADQRDGAEPRVPGAARRCRASTADASVDRPQRAVQLQHAAVAQPRPSRRGTATTTATSRRPSSTRTYYVRFDAVPEEIEGYVTHQYDITRQNFDAVRHVQPDRATARCALGYGHEAFERHGRGFSDVGENIVRRVVRRDVAQRSSRSAPAYDYGAAARRRLRRARASTTRSRTRASSPACATTTRPTATAAGRR